MTRTRELVAEEIIRVATACFNERGYQATTIEDIAARAGISRVTFYTYFKSKEELLQTIFDRSLSAYQQGLEAILAADSPRREKLHRVVVHQIASLTADQPAIRVFFSEEKALPPQVAQRVQAVHRQIDRLLEREIASGIERGEIIDIDPRLLMYAFAGMCNWLYRWYRPGGTITPEMIAETFTRILERGCLRTQPQPDTLSTAERLQRLEERVGQLQTELKHVSRHLRTDTRGRLANPADSKGKPFRRVK